MPELRLPWLSPRENGALAVVLVASAPARAGRLTTDGYAQAERLGSHLAGRTDGLYSGPEPACVATAASMGAPAVLQALALPSKRSGWGPPAAGRGARPALDQLALAHPPGGLVVVVLHPHMVAALAEQVAGLPRLLRTVPPPTGCRTLTWQANQGWALLPGTWLPA